MRLALALIVLAVTPGSQSTQDRVAGTWRGDSTCTANRGPCVDEKVVYYITEVLGMAGVVSIRADKIVNGRPITMGTGEWRYDNALRMLVWKMPRQTWSLNVRGESMEGTLTLADNTVIRRLTLKKDR